MQRTSKNLDIVIFHSSCVPSFKKAIFRKCIVGYLEILSTVSDSCPALKFKNELHHTALVNFTHWFQTMQRILQGILQHICST
jgi:hypothetical protein